MSHLELETALIAACDLLGNSEPSDWSPLSPDEVRKTLLVALEKLRAGLPVDKLGLSVEFAPTSTIQEIAMANAWHDKYLELAEVVDKYT